MKREFALKGNTKDISSLQPSKKASVERETYDYMVKIIIVGDSGVGKTNIISRYCCKEGQVGEFKDYHVATIGVDFSTKMIKIDGRRLKLQIWDTAGQQRFRTITQTYYKGAAGIILAYSVDSLESFLNIQTWMQQITQRSTESVRKILVANKIDVEDEYDQQFCLDQPRKISSERGRALAEKYGMDYYQVSAKNNQGIQEMFGELALHVKLAIEKVNIIRNGVEDVSRTLTINSAHTRTIRKVVKDGIQYKVQEQASLLTKFKQKVCNC